MTKLKIKQQHLKAEREKKEITLKTAWDKLSPKQRKICKQNKQELTQQFLQHSMGNPLIYQEGWIQSQAIRRLEQMAPEEIINLKQDKSDLTIIMRQLAQEQNEWDKQHEQEQQKKYLSLPTNKKAFQKGIQQVKRHLFNTNDTREYIKAYHTVHNQINKLNVPPYQSYTFNTETKERMQQGLDSIEPTQLIETTASYTPTEMAIACDIINLQKQKELANKNISNKSLQTLILGSATIGSAKYASIKQGNPFLAWGITGLIGLLAFIKLYQTFKASQHSKNAHQKINRYKHTAKIKALLNTLQKHQTTH